jgi:hypothetical protein
LALPTSAASSASDAALEEGAAWTDGAPGDSSSALAASAPRDQAGQSGDTAPPGDDHALKQANNPLANMTAVNLQNYRISEVEGVDNSANQFWFRYAKPVTIGDGKWLVRASLPLVTVPTSPLDSESGIGDSNVFAAYLFDTDDPSVSFGVGPLLGVPTATEDEVGTGQWSAGAAAVLFDARSSVIQYGGLVTYQTKIAGSDRVDDLSLLAVQPFGFLQLGSGVYLRSVGIWAFDLESGDYSIPIGAGLGKVVKMGKVVFNFYLEPQYTVLHEGAGQPEYQILFGFNTQFF